MSEPGKVFITTMRLVPKKGLSKTVRRLAGVRSKMAVRRFAARFDVAVEEAEKPIDEYESVLDFFTRRLKPGARPIDPDEDAVVSPVDGSFLVGGPIVDGRLFQAKGRDYSLAALLANEDADEIFRGGAYATVYLAPRDYHRIHSPVDGVITGCTAVPGDLYPVNPAAVAHVHELFARNERLITSIQSETFGAVDVVKVGATNVGYITAVYDDSIHTNVGANEVVRRRYEQPIPVKKGDELGIFEMGSTVIVVIEKGLDFIELGKGDPVRMGTKMATLQSEGLPPKPGSDGSSP